MTKEPRNPAADGTVHTHADGTTHTHADGTTHTHADGTTHTHSHGGHSHTHDPAEMKKITNRLAKSIGHLTKVKQMIENGDDCSDVLIQLAAVRSEITNAGKALLKQHLDHCIVEAVAENDQESIRKMNAAIDTFMK